MDPRSGSSILGLGLLVMILLALAEVNRLNGQAADGNLFGIVIDQSGASVPNANVEIKNTATGVSASTTTTTQGEYRFKNLLTGTYELKITGTGFKTTTLRNVFIALNQTATANVTLAVGDTATIVDVADTPALIDTTTAQVSNTFTARLAADLPSAANNNGVLNLALLGAGVASAGGFGTVNAPSVGGQRPRNNSFTIEGVDNNSKYLTGALVAVPNDSVAEFTLLQNQFSAEFGHSSGGQFNTVVKGGTNQLHGTVYEYLNNRNLDALDQVYKRQGFTDRPRFDSNTMGAAVGGPIVKNKVFYYGNFDYTPVGANSSSSASPTFAPTAQGYTMLANIPGLSQTNLNVLKQYLAPAPAQAAGASGFTKVQGVPIPLGILPIVAPNYSNTYRWLGSLDYDLSDRDQLRGRYIGNRQSGIYTALTSLPVFYVERPILSNLIALSEFHNFRPNLTNELRLAFNRSNDTTPTPNVQFPGLDTFPNIQIQNDLNLQLGPSINGPQATVLTTYQLADNVSWTKGEHDLKFGFDGRSEISAITFVQRLRGDYDYTTLQRYLLDLTPDILAQRSTGSKRYYGNQRALYFFANDNWRINHHFTLDAGLRYEFTSVPKSMKEFALNSLADVPGVLTFSEPQPQKTNFAPRLGFAYSPGNTGRTSIRGGFGIAYDVLFDNIGTNYRPPQATSLVDRTGGNATGFLANGGIPPTAQAAGLTPAQARALTSFWLPDQTLPYALTWNLGIQHVFSKDYTLEVRYLGTRGVHLPEQTELNRKAIVTSTHNLPTYLSAPSQSTLDALPLSLTTLTNERNASGNIWAPYGFAAANISSVLPIGNSSYHGLATELTRRFSNGLLFKTAYTWSHNIDDSTAEFNTTTLSPRRPQDFFNLKGEKAASLLDRRHRLTFTWLYETPWFAKTSSALQRSLLSGYQLSGTYTFESPEYITPQSTIDSNLNGDAASDRVIINPNGVPGSSSDVTALKNSAGATVAYLAMNPHAEFIRAQAGAFANSGRNILAASRINNFDLSVKKSFFFRERYRTEIRADFFNAFNHAQYTPGAINTIGFVNRSVVTNYLTPGNALFGQYDQVFSSNPRSIQLAAKFVF